ncbi:MAG: chemotaxis protein CheW [Methyloceanibacter sp.]|uniref:hybrid sensor histidine kinase/response regulator n=1 Tax=Methyloceanibacter sp. TaxID=1965321 RepID=UPI003D6D4390
MDELLAEFLTETGERLDQIDVDLVRFEQEPNDADMLNAIFRLVHTVKGTCGFLGLDRLAKLAHAAETLMGQYRAGAAVTVEGVSVILASIDRIKEILSGLEGDGVEPPGSDADLIDRLQALAEVSALGHSGGDGPIPWNAPEPGMDRVGLATPGLATLEELERAWRETPGPDPLPEFGSKPEPARATMVVGGDDRGLASENGTKGLAARVQTVRVSVETLEHLMTTVSELVLTRNQLLDLVRRRGDSEFKTPLQRLSNVTMELQEGIMKARMQPIANAWQKLPRLVRELSLELGKKIELDMTGGETELDRQVLEMIKDPLTHMIRNSADHGLELLAERVRAGKPDTGRIKLSAYQQGGYIVIEVADDGRGLDVQRVRAKALENGLTTLAELDRMSDLDTVKFIFKPGFSTASAVSEVSGRGVGMDVVRNNIELIGGTVDLKSTSSVGTTFVIKIPLTLAIMAALIVEVGGERFAIPQFSVIELVRTGEAAGHPVVLINDTPVLRLRAKLLPLLDFSQLLGIKSAEPSLERVRDTSLTAVVIQVGASLFGVLVDKVFRTEEIVVKPMSSLLRHVTMFSGTTILGDGSVIMIIDPNAVGAIAGSLDTQVEAAHVAPPETDKAEESRTALLLFRAGAKTLKAVPLSLITRLEEVAIEAIENCNGQDVVQYRGALMPIVYIQADRVPRESGVQPVLVFTEGEHPAGLAIDEIVDIVEEPLTIDLKAETPGVIGGAIIRGKAVEIVDVSHYLGAVFAQHLRGTLDEVRELRVLLVDDSQFFRNMLAPLLKASGYEVALAASGEEALALKDKGERFDLIISDIDMPGMDGIALAEQIKADPTWSKVPLIALSSHLNPRLMERSRAAGFENYVGKFDRQKLMHALQDCVKGWGAAA